MVTKTISKSKYTGGLVDLKAGQISREIFVNEEIYRQEQERVFTRSWLFVAHEQPGAQARRLLRLLHG